MQEKFLPQFLKNLKQDFLHKREYLKLLKINSKFIQICECPHRIYHSYCAAAYIIRAKKIYCKNCYSYYHLNIKREKLISTRNSYTILKYCVLFLFFLACVIGVAILDSHMKNEAYEGLVAQGETNLEENHTGYLQLVEMGMTLLVIWIWCLSLFLMKSFSQNKRITQVEVLDPNKDEFQISRHRAK